MYTNIIEQIARIGTLICLNLFQKDFKFKHWDVFKMAKIWKEMKVLWFGYTFKVVALNTEFQVAVLGRQKSRLHDLRLNPVH